MLALCCQRRRLSVASSTVLGGTWRVSTQNAECVEFEAPRIDAKGVAIGWGMGSKYSPPQPTIRGLGERIVSSPPRSPGRAPAKNDFTNF